MKRFHISIFLLSLMIMSLPGCMTAKSRDAVAFNSGQTLREIWRIVYNTPLHFDGSISYPDAIKKYFSYYQLDFEGVPHYFGSLRSGDYLIATHVFVPDYAIETVYMMHGYLMHSGIFNKFIKQLIDANYAVVVFDLPGHGFSSGDRADIKSFSDYVSVLDDVINLTCETIVPKPYALIGHSMGCSVVIEYLLSRGHIFKHYILSAPLIRSNMWDISQAGVVILGGLIKVIPAFVTDLSSDEEYIEFLKTEEPLRCGEFPISWVLALKKWNEKLESLAAVSDIPLLVIQGKKDSVVEWKYNTKFISRFFPDSDIHYISAGKHELFQDKKEVRDEMFGLIMKRLQEKYPD